MTLMREPLQNARNVHTLMQHAHDHYSCAYSLIKDQVAFRTELQITGPDKAHILAHGGKVSKLGESLVHFANVPLGTVYSPIPNRALRNLFDVRVSSS